jgi:hypothetical protein
MLVLGSREMTGITIIVVVLAAFAGVVSLYCWVDAAA